MKMPTPAILPPLEPAFQPLSLLVRNYTQSLANTPNPDLATIALERNEGRTHTLPLQLHPQGSPHDATTRHLVERLAKFLLWQVGGWKLTFAGPQQLGQQLSQVYHRNGTRHFDAELMEKVYDRPFEFVQCHHNEAPNANESGITLGGHLDGCRLGFDLGASDYKLAAVQDGEAVFTTEIRWDPKNQPDPEIHFKAIHEGLQLAAKHLPRVDAIGGSAAGIYVNNEVKVASLFRAVPQNLFDTKVRPLFHRLQQTWNVPLEVANDGDVTALAAAMALRVNGILGIAMGSSQAAGYLDSQGHITGWLNELAFAPVDVQPHGPVDEWSKDQGVGALYFSQQAVGRLLQPAGIPAPEEMPLPEKLVLVQKLMEQDDPRAEKIYTSIGVYLGYALALYAQLYQYQHVLLLGRVTTGKGADIIVNQAQTVLNQEFPEYAQQLQIHLPDEKSKRVGQAVAAASLPAIPQS